MLLGVLEPTSFSGSFTNPPFYSSFFSLCRSLSLDITSLNPKLRANSWYLNSSATKSFGIKQYWLNVTGRESKDWWLTSHLYIDRIIRLGSSNCVWHMHSSEAVMVPNVIQMWIHVFIVVTNIFHVFSYSSPLTARRKNKPLIWNHLGLVAFSGLHGYTILIWSKL